MCILITVVDDDGRLFGVTSMSSNDAAYLVLNVAPLAVMADIYAIWVSYLELIPDTRQ